VYPRHSSAGGQTTCPKTQRSRPPCRGRESRRGTF
jgi:hypothetical protein